MKFITERRKVKRLRKFPSNEGMKVEVRKANKMAGSNYQFTRTGMRPWAGCVFRSAWENNCAAVLHAHGIKFEYETKKFEFPIKKGTKSYLVDFYLPDTDEYLEVKGYWNDKSFTKLNRVRIHHPDDYEKMWILTGRAKRSLQMLEKLQFDMSRVIFYGDLRREYKDLIRPDIWEGK